MCIITVVVDKENRLIPYEIEHDGTFALCKGYSEDESYVKLVESRNIDWEMRKVVASG